MSADLRLFSEHESGRLPNTLRLYSWRPNCISLGYSQEAEEEVDGQRAAKLGWNVVQRPTGGGIVFHNEAEVTYSLIMDIGDPSLPSGLVPAYKKISEAIVAGLRILGLEAEIRNSKHEARNKLEALNPNSPNQLCFAYPAEYEVVCRGKKIVGSAQKRGKKSLLQQGSIFVRANRPEIFSVLKRPYETENSISVEESLGRPVGQGEILSALKAGFSEIFGVNL